MLISKPSRNLYIKNCKFAHNSQHKGHGAAIQFLAAHIQTRLMIDRCNFSYNGAAKSIIYIGRSSEKEIYLYLQNSMFIGNEGVPIYLSQQKLHIKGDMLFKHNKAITGGGIYGSSSAVIFKNKSNVTFYNNSAITDGGAMFINNSRMHFAKNSVISSANNFAKSFSNALYSMNKTAVLFGCNTMVTFKSNKAGDRGRTLYLENCNVLFDEIQK